MAEGTVESYDDYIRALYRLPKAKLVQLVVVVGHGHWLVRRPGAMEQGRTGFGARLCKAR